MTAVRQKMETDKKEKTALRPLHKEKSIKPAAKNSSTEDILKTYRPLFEENGDLIANAQNGLAVSAVNDFIILSGKSQKEVAELIHTTPKTLQNYASGAKKLPTIQSELLLKLFALYYKGLGIFDGAKSFNSWLSAPAFGLYNVVPDTLLTTSTGINEVIDELIKIEYGDYS